MATLNITFISDAIAPLRVRIALLTIDIADMRYAITLISIVVASLGHVVTPLGIRTAHVGRIRHGTASIRLRLSFAPIDIARRPVAHPERPYVAVAPQTRTRKPTYYPQRDPTRIVRRPSSIRANTIFCPSRSSRRHYRRKSPISH